MNNGGACWQYCVCVRLCGKRHNAPRQWLYAGNVCGI